MDTFKPTTPMPAYGERATSTVREYKNDGYDPLFNGPATRAALGISAVTEWRWLKDPAMNYPPHDLVINGRNYRKLSTINKFIAERTTRTKAARKTQLMGPNAETLSRTLGKASRSGRGWQCRCLAHDDKNPSQSRSSAESELADALNVSSKTVQRLGLPFTRGPGGKRIYNIACARDVLAKKFGQ